MAVITDKREIYDSERDLQMALHDNFCSRPYHLVNKFIFRWESDYLNVTDRGFIYEYEIKRTFSDFKADEKKEVKTMDEVVESIKSYVDVKFADMMKEIKAVTSKDISDGDSKPIEEKKVEIPKEDAQKLVKALSE